MLSAKKKRGTGVIQNLVDPLFSSARSRAHWIDYIHGFVMGLYSATNIIAFENTRTTPITRRVGIPTPRASDPVEVLINTCLSARHYIS